jgi:hypothetical protein
MKTGVVLLTLENCGISSRLFEGIYDRRGLSMKGRKAIRAATELGIAEQDTDGCIHWNADYQAIAADKADWKQFLAIMKHHVTYLNLVQVGATSQITGSTAQAQARADPYAYRAYLEGVAESHRDRAEAFARLAPLQDVRSLVDLGGGLGAYSTAWVDSHPLRVATLLDLPEVIEMLATCPPRLGTRLRFHAADLTKIASLPKGEVYLLANVLHLFRGWRKILRNVLSLMPANAQLVVLEATPAGASGAFFDLQVHLRSVRGGGLLKPATLENFLFDCGLRAFARRELGTVKDPLDREYSLWLGTKRA